MQEELIIVVSLWGIAALYKDLLNNPGPVVLGIIGYLSDSVKLWVRLQESYR